MVYILHIYLFLLILDDFTVSEVDYTRAQSMMIRFDRKHATAPCELMIFRQQGAQNKMKERFALTEGENKLQCVLLTVWACTRG